MGNTTFEAIGTRRSPPRVTLTFEAPRANSASAPKAESQKLQGFLLHLSSRCAGGEATRKAEHSCQSPSLCRNSLRCFVALFHRRSARLSFTRPLSSMPMHFTQTASPTFTTSSVRFTRKSASSEMWHEAFLAGQHLHESSQIP